MFRDNPLPARPLIPDIRRWLATEFRSPGTRHFVVTLAGNISRFALGFVASVLIARGLGPAGYGLVALVSAALGLVDTIGDFGLTFAAIRAISRSLDAEPNRARWLAHGYLSLAMIANAAAAGAGFVFAGPIAELMLGRTDAEPYVRLALLGLVSVAGNGFATALLQSTRRFGELAALQVLTAFTYILGIVALAIAGRLDVVSVVLLGAVNPLVGFVIGLVRLPWISLDKIFARPARRTWGELVVFGKWLWASAILSLLASQLDLVMLSHWAPPAVVGVYALAFNLALKMDIVNQTRFTVLMPAVSALQTRQAIGEFVRRNLARSMLMGAGLALTIPFFQPFIIAFYGPAYAGAIQVLIVLTVVVIHDLVTSPLILLAFAMGQPRALAASDAVRVTILLGAGWLLIPSFGPIGAALARLAARGAGAAFILTLIALRSRRMSK